MGQPFPSELHCRSTSGFVKVEINRLQIHQKPVGLKYHNIHCLYAVRLKMKAFPLAIYFLFHFQTFRIPQSPMTHFLFLLLQDFNRPVLSPDPPFPVWRERSSATSKGGT